MAALPCVAILAHRGDLAAVSLAAALHRRGGCRVIIADEYDLVRAGVVHRPSSGPVNGDAPAAVAPSAGDVVTLPDGTRITCRTEVVLCRIAALPAATQSDPGHQAYADAETFALGLSWLAGLGAAVVNRPSPLGLSGVEPDLLHLHRLAATVGLAAPRLMLATNAARSPVEPGFQPLEWPAAGLPGSYAPAPHLAGGPPLSRPLIAGEPVLPLGAALVLGREVLGGPPALHDRLTALGAALGLAMYEVGLGQASSADEPVVTGLSAVPRLTWPGQLTAVADYLERRGRDRLIHGSIA